MEVRPPGLLLAALTLAKGAGGIAELSRQVFKALVEMHGKDLFDYELIFQEAALVVDTRGRAKQKNERIFPA